MYYNCIWIRIHVLGSLKLNFKLCFSIWDEFVHQDPSPIADKTNGDVAADSYHKYKEDVQLVKNGGVSWDTNYY
jgi:hypothetical protein